MVKLLSCVFILIFCAFPKDIASRRHGHYSKDNHHKIVGGEQTTIEKFPHQVYLLLQKGEDNYQCGGSLISEHYVLVAAHCLADGIETVHARVGSTNSMSGGHVYQSTDFISHPKYNNKNYDYDVGLIHFADKIKIDDKTSKIIKLADSGSSVAPNTSLTITGWGATSEGGDVSPVLMVVTVPTISNKECSKIYGNITPRMFCAGLPEGGKDSCQGDSGGPAITDKTIQIGVVSFGIGCARKGKPGVYTNVASVRNWIKQNSGV